MSRNGRLADDTAIVTGAGQNIGEEMAKTFAREGANVVVADVDGDRARTTADDIVSDGGEAIPVVADVSDESDVVSMIEKTEEEYESIDVLVNNVSITERVGLLDLSTERFDEITAVNLRGTFLCTREAAKSMRSSGGGRILNVASTSAHVGRAEAAAYATTKSGIVNFTRSAAVALAEHDIRVNTLSPTRTGSRLGMETDRDGEVPDDILVGRWGEPLDQANAALFLVSPESEFVNGTELLVDGGTNAAGH